MAEPLPPKKAKKESSKDSYQAEFIRAANEDDDGYDPYSDRPAREPQYEEDPWR